MTDRLDETIFGADGAGDTTPAPLVTRASRRAQQESRPPAVKPPGARAARRGLVLLVTVALVAGAALAAFTVLRPWLEGLRAPKDYPGPGSGSVSFVISPGDTGGAIGQRLQAADIVLTSGAFVEAFTADPKAAGIQPGSYTLKKQMKASDALTALLDPANRSVPRVTIREGMWVSEVFAALSKGTATPLTDYTAAAKDPAALGLPAEAKGNLEGYLFPATYEFAEHASAAEQLTTMIRTTTAKLTELGVTAAKAHDVLTMASILEAEARTLADREKVARVLLNRIADRDYLQLDSTVSYAAQRRSVTTTDAERASTSPYNTYTHRGMPPGPIANPGLVSIQAALTPATGTWRYFVAVNPETGETKFANTFAEHEKNVALFQAWCRAHPGKC
ncbi:MAG TPA: endolytic transglycosylase MltG [Dermatophilaceae bacterium]|nr:endolytic transglycosylase MltG [Dermatophilaceae bacterium]